MSLNLWLRITELKGISAPFDVIIVYLVCKQIKMLTMGKRSWTFNHQVRNISFPTWVLLNDMSGQHGCHMPTCCCCWFYYLEALLRIYFVLSRDLFIGNSGWLSWQDFNTWFDDALLSTSVHPAIHPSIHAFYLSSNLLSIYLLWFFSSLAFVYLLNSLIWISKERQIL